MLGKLLKYELKATGRTFIPLYGVLLLLAVINKIFYIFQDAVGWRLSGPVYRLPEAIGGIATFLYIFLIIAIFIITFVVMMQRFYKNLLGDEGYLMFTLPVKPWQLISSKLISSVIWLIASGLVTMISIFILSLSTSFFSELIEFFDDFAEMMFYQFNVFIFLGEFAALLLVGTICSILEIYMCIAIGHQVTRHKILASFGAYLAVTTVLQVVITVLTFFMSLFLDMWDWAYYYWNFDYTIFHIFFIGGIVINLILSAVFFFVTNVLLEKKLNLE